MGRFFLSLFFLLQTLGISSAFDDQPVCGRLTKEGPGLYLTSPAGSVASSQMRCDQSGLCFQKVGTRISFDDAGRLFFVGAPSPSGEEVIWHIRMQTLARNLDGADLAYLSRPTTTTRCSPSEPLPGFPASSFPLGPFIPINDYIDHHDGRPTGLLTRYFHFQIQEVPGGRCISTDDRRAFKDQRSIYGFENVPRMPKNVAQLLYGSPAVAGANSFASLSSEFIYRDDPKLPCFGFGLPVPTRTGFLNQKVNWAPYSTKIWIKRFRGKQVMVESGFDGRVIQWVE